MLVFVALVAVGTHLAPHVTRGDILFGVTVVPGFAESVAGRRISRQYAIEVWLLAAAAALVVMTSSFPSVSGTMLLAQSLGASVAFVRARNRVRPHAARPATVREAVIGPSEAMPGGVIGQLGPFLLLVATAAYVAFNWDSVPERFPTHWNLAGMPDGWTTKSPGGVFRGVAVGFVICASLWFTGFAVLRWTRLPRVTGADGASARRVRRAHLVAMLANGYLIAALLSWTTVFAMFASTREEQILPALFRVAPFALLIFGTLAVRVMRRTATSGGAPVGDTTPDSSWLFGHLYVNRHDPALFVEKRMGIGYTLNLGNAWSWLVMAVFAMGIAIPMMLVP